jgi:hypothetical protein
VEAKLVGDFSGVHGVLANVSFWASLITWATYGKILLVGKYQEEGVTEFILVQHALKLFACLNNTISVVGVDYKDDTLGVLEIMPPQRSNLVLSTNIPHCELNVLVLDSLDVEACARGQKVQR